MTHLDYATSKGRTLYAVSGRNEAWHGIDGWWLYSIRSRRWTKAEMTV